MAASHPGPPLTVLSLLISPSGWSSLVHDQNGYGDDQNFDLIRHDFAQDNLARAGALPNSKTKTVGWRYVDVAFRSFLVRSLHVY
jgi:hypothetical protein